MQNKLTVIVLLFSIVSAFAQRMVVWGSESRDTTKCGEEELFFGDFRSPVEFVEAPSFDGATGCRLYRDSIRNGWLFDVKHIVNWKEVNDSVDRAYAPDRTVRSLTLEQWERMREENRVRAEQSRVERLKRYRVTERTVPISDSLAQNICLAIENGIREANRTMSEGQVASESADGVEIIEIVADGTLFTFRCVVGDQLWRLKVHESEQILPRLTDLFRAMIADVEAGRVDETRYLDRLN